MLKNLLLFGLTLTLMVGVMFATLSCSDDNLKTQLSIDNTVVYDKTNDEFKGKNGPDELDVDVSDIVILGENNEKKDVVSILINEKVDV